MHDVYAKIDLMGLYVRIGRAPVISFLPCGWGGIYYTASLVTPPGPEAEPRRAVAFEVYPGNPVPYGFLAFEAREPEPGFRQLVDAAIAEFTPGWPA